MDQNGVLIEKIYNPSVGKYDVRVITGPGYATKRQEALDGMTQVLQGNPALMQIAGDLLVKNMDWPGAEEIAKRMKKTIDPKILADEDDPALAAANQQMEAMQAEMENMFQMLQNVNQSMEVRDLEIKEQANQIKAFDAETKRISAVQAGMSEQQIQDIAMGVVAAAMESNDNMVMMNEQRQMPEMQPEMMPEMMPPEGEMNEMR